MQFTINSFRQLFPDNFLIFVKFPDISRFSRKVVTLFVPCVCIYATQTPLFQGPDRGVSNQRTGKPVKHKLFANSDGDWVWRQRSPDIWFANYHHLSGRHEYVNREPQTYTILILNWNLFVVFTCWYSCKLWLKLNAEVWFGTIMADAARPATSCLPRDLALE